MNQTVTIHLTKPQFELLVQCVGETEERERSMKYLIQFGNLHYEHEQEFLDLMNEREADLYRLIRILSNAAHESEESNHQ